MMAIDSVSTIEANGTLTGEPAAVSTAKDLAAYYAADRTPPGLRTNAVQWLQRKVMAAARELPRRFDTLAAWEQFRGELRGRLPAVIGRPEFPPLRESVTRARVQVGKDVICERVDVHVDAEGARGCDLIALPETWMGQADHDPEELAGPTVTLMSELACRHSTYIVCPIDRIQGTIDRIEGAQRLNTAVLIDRRGKITGSYDKVFPYWSEFDVTPPVSVGTTVPVFDTDCGRIAITICFDVNFPEVWQRLAELEAELVIWPSAYSAGTSLQAHALNHHFYIVTSTQTCDCLVYDITGQQLLYEKAAEFNVSRIALDLDRGIYHSNFNLDKRDRLLAEHGDAVEQELWMELESWFVLRARRPGVSARQLARAYGLEELRDYIDRSRREIDAMRGFTFAAGPPQAAGESMANGVTAGNGRGATAPTAT